MVSTAELVQRVRDDGATALVLHESATVKLTELPVAQADSLLLIVGPEGGIADDEIAALSDAGATAVRLGPTVLRTSTAAAVALGALGALTPRWCDWRRLSIGMRRYPAVKWVFRANTRPEPRKQAESPT